MALFAAIIAVGLGPAMWLGAQFGNVADAPSAPPAVRSQHRPDHSQDKGGVAGSAPQDPAAVIETDPRADIKPLGDRRSHPAVIRTSKAPTKDAPSTAPPSASSAPSTGGTTSSAPPTDPTAPADPPPGGGGGGGNGGGGQGPVQPSAPSDSAPGGGGTD